MLLIFCILDCRVFDVLLAGAKAKDWNGSLPLHVACAEQAPVEVVRALLEAHGDGEAA